MSTLTRENPGAILKRKPVGKLCDACAKENKQVNATVEIIGEVDSFGSERIYLCGNHTTGWLRRNREYVVRGQCDWCNEQDVRLHYRRDPEEGSSGRVYELCLPCTRKMRE